LIETGDTGFVVLDEKGVVVHANARYAHLAGHGDVDQILGKSILDWTAPHDRERLLRELIGCWNKGFARNVKIRHIDRRGATTPVEVSVTRIGSGEGSALIAFCRDPSEGEPCAPAKEAFAESVLFGPKNTFFAVLGNLPVGIALVDHTGVCGYLNPEFTGITGYTLEDVPTETDWLHQAYPDAGHRKKVLDVWNRDRLPGGIHEVAQCRIACKDGQEKTISLRAACLKDLIVIALGDSTAEKEIESALKRNEDRYRSIYENAIEGIFQSSAQGRFLSANPSHAKMLGYDSPEQMIGDIADIGRQLFVNPGDHREFTKLLETRGIVENFETRLYRKDGGTIWASLNVRTAFDESGGILYHEGTAEDITRRKQMEEEKKELEARLRQSEKMEAIGKLAGGIAHDFNNVLGVLLGHCGILKMKIPTDDPLQVRVRQIVDTIEKASRFTRSLLTFSRKQDVLLEPVRINPAIETSVRILTGLLPKNIDLEMVLDDPDVTVMADPSKIDQVMLNLITNARDAMPQGGKITIRSETVVLGEEFRRSHGYGLPGRYAAITVADTGPGIDDDAKDKIFEPFYTTKKEGRGTGLGLAIAYGIVRQHNGYITVFSEPERGATFNVYLPVTRTRRPDDAADRSPMDL